MKVRVTMDVMGRQIDETLVGQDADDIVSQSKARVAQELGWMGVFLRPLSPLAFAQEAVRRYNSAHATSYALPQSADEFLKLGQDLGYLTVLPTH